jgi:hypothetical protein
MSILRHTLVKVGGINRKQVIIPILSFLILFSCSAQDEEIILEDTETYITKETQTKYTSVGCIIPPGVTCPMQKCQRDTYSDCKRATPCKCVDSKIIDAHYPGISPEEFGKIEHRKNRDFMLELWKDDPETFYHPDSLIH